MRIDFQAQFAPPPGAADVLLVRHGSCNAPEPDGLIGGRSDPPLNEAGRTQALALADRLGDRELAALFITPLRRTGETAAPLAERAGLDPVVVPELNEVFLGEWEGHEIHRRGSAADPDFLAMLDAGRWDVIPGAEPGDVFTTRVRAGLEQVADAGRDGAQVVAVIHGAVLAEALRQMTGANPFAFLGCANGGVSRVVRMPDGRWVLVSYNDTTHLDGR